MRKQLVLAWAAIAFISGAVVACGNNGGGNNSAPVVVNPYGVCATAGCVPGTLAGEIFNAQKIVGATSNSYFAENGYGLSFAATQAAQNFSNVGITTLDPVNYYGGVSVNGTIQIRQVPYSYCNLPMGDYAVTTIASGQWFSATFNSVQVQLNGPVSATAILSGVVGAKSSQYSSWTWQEVPVPRIGVIYEGRLIIQSLNGMQCLVSVSL